MALFEHVAYGRYNEVAIPDVIQYDDSNIHSFARTLLDCGLHRQLLLLIDMGKIRPAHNAHKQILPQLVHNLAEYSRNTMYIDTARRLIDCNFETESVGLLRAICDCETYDRAYLGVTLLVPLARRHTISYTWDFVVLEKLFDLEYIAPIQIRTLLRDIVAHRCGDIIVEQPPIIVQWFKLFPGVAADMVDPHIPLAYLEILLDMGLVFDEPARARVDEVRYQAIAARDKGRAFVDAAETLPADDLISHYIANIHCAATFYSPQSTSILLRRVSLKPTTNWRPLLELLDLIVTTKGVKHLDIIANWCIRFEATDTAQTELVVRIFNLIREWHHPIPVASPRVPVKYRQYFVDGAPRPSRQSASFEIRPSLSCYDLYQATHHLFTEIKDDPQYVVCFVNAACVFCFTREALRSHLDVSDRTTLRMFYCEIATLDLLGLLAHDWSYYTIQMGVPVMIDMPPIATV